MTLPPPEISKRLIALHAELGLSKGGEKLDEDAWVAGRTRIGVERLARIFCLDCYPVVYTPQKSPPVLRSARFDWTCQHERAARAGAQRAQARNALIRLLAEHSLSWASDLPSILAADWLEKNPVSKPSATASPGSSDLNVNLLDLNQTLIEDRAVLTPAESIVCALWNLNSYVYHEFEHAPQLGIVAPASGYGKTTLLRTLKAMAADAWYSHSATAPAIYRKLRRQPHMTALLDEAENADMLADRKLRAVLDTAYEGGGIDLVEDGESIKIQVFAPVAWAIRGEIHDVPLSILSRAFIIQPKRATPTVRCQRRDPDLLEVQRENSKWAATCKLDRDPPIPAELQHDPRLADTARPLLSIADNLSRGDEARAALIELCADRSHPDVAAMALLDSHKVLTVLGIDRIAKNKKDTKDGALTDKVIELGDRFWSNWRGINDHGQPHELTSNELSRLLRRFGVRPRTVWPVPRLPNSRSFLGYYLEDIERAVRHYFPETSTSTQVNKIIHLAKS